jgi:hypothetical protein
MSEQGSLHSMRSHFSPSIHGSTGSAPSSSRREYIGSVNSNSSRPSAYSVARSQGSGHSAAQSLVRTGSISSEERRRGSPVLSAFGSSQARAGGGGGGGGGAGSSAARVRSPSPFGLYPPELPASPPTIGSPPSAHMSPHKATTIRSVASSSLGSTTLVADTSFGSTVRVSTSGAGSISPLSASFPLNAAPWVSGLDGDWQPSA